MSEKGNTGYRERLRERFLAGEAEARSDENILELLLTFAIGRKDVKPLAQDLIRTFGGLAQVLSASPAELYKIKGIGESSVALLKVVRFFQTGEAPGRILSPMPVSAGAQQQKLFDSPLHDQSPELQILVPQSILDREPKEPTIRPTQMEDEIAESKARQPRKPKERSEKAPLSEKPVKRKFQVSNGYLLEFDQLARILHFLLERRGAKKISRKVLQEETGLADRQVESLVSMGSSIGLIKPAVQVLTRAGVLIAEHDIFLERKGSLEWCHYKAAGSRQNLVWFEVFNHLLAEESSMNQAGWQEYFRSKLKGQYTDKTIRRHLPKEVRFVIDSYTKRNFRKLGILHQSPEERFYRRRYTEFAPLVLVAMVYDFCARNEAGLFQVGEMARTPGSPAVVFGLDETSFRKQIEGLHDRGWLRYETTHNLDQIRLKPGFSALEFLTAHFEDREPQASPDPSPGGNLE